METNLKPFDLQKALAGEKVQTREGKPVTDLHYFKDAISDDKLMAVVDGRISSYYDNGNFYKDKRESAVDLFMAPVTVERWVNVYKRLLPTTGFATNHEQLYDTKEIGESCAHMNNFYIGTFPITITL